MGGTTERISLSLLSLLLLLLPSAADASPSAALVKHLSSLLKWATASPTIPQSDGDVLQFENGYVVETLVEGSKLGVQPYTVRVSPEGELFSVDSINSNIVRITPPLSQYSRARLVAGSFEGYSGHVDGKPSDARFNHPKGVTMDDKGNVYVADTSNLAIRKIGEAGVTTIAGGKSNVAGYRDGPSEDAKFSNDFDVVYVGSTCSLLVIDRGNAAIRQISLQQEDCNYQYNSISTSDVIMVFGAVLVGYITCLLQRGFSIFEKTKQYPGVEYQDHNTKEKPSLHVEALKDDVVAGWPSFGRLLLDLSRSAIEAFGYAVLSLVPGSLFFWRSKKGLTPLKDHLVMPEDREEIPLVQKQKCSLLPSETLLAPTDATCAFAPKPQKVSKLPTFKDPNLSAKHRSSKRQDFGDFFGTSEAQQVGSKSLKDRSRHRYRDKSGEVSFANSGTEQKPVEVKQVNYADAKFDHFNIRTKFGADNAFHF